ncbi:diacylglycerol kinase family protein [Caulobacter segnis]|uniref:diacylglycerol/lipid kinase family protein n=1 Tax=Caulobacter segnis TaxID=88688 RepID=UPI0024108563|nr:diacylglycerol kinase family protein [Caulobacter segnis]MDG2521619.1 diacylglycerol kinase family protein [Caulobacter segnis]
MSTDPNPPPIRHVEVVVNPLSGSAGPNAKADAEAILARHEVKWRVCTPEDGVVPCLQRAIDAGPDLLVVVAGDGTARCAAEMAGSDGPLVAPLPGGTMNMLPKQLYGDRDWKTALDEILTRGVVAPVSGGEVDGRMFFVAAILGAPAHWAEAREAVREGRLWLAVQRARRAVRRAFTGRLRYALDGGKTRKTEALTLMCPLVSTIMDNDARVLEATAVDPAGARDIFRLGFHAAVGDWRAAPSVHVDKARYGAVWAGGRIPAILDGEPQRLGRTAQIKFRPDAFRALVPEAP